MCCLWGQPQYAIHFIFISKWVCDVCGHVCHIPVRVQGDSFVQSVLFLKFCGSQDLNYALSSKHFIHWAISLAHIYFWILSANIQVSDTIWDLRNRIVSKPTKKGRWHVISERVISSSKSSRKKAGYVLHYCHKAKLFLDRVEGEIPKENQWEVLRSDYIWDIRNLFMVGNRKA